MANIAYHRARRLAALRPSVSLPPMQMRQLRGFGDVPAAGSTTAVNPPNGSVDQGGPADKVCAAWLAADSSSAQVVTALDQSGWNDWALKNFNEPFWAPSVMGDMVSWSVHLFGAIASAYHGNKRGKGAVGPMLGWGVLGYMFPLPTVTVAMFTGFGQPAAGARSSRRRTRAAA